jgi:hypothetical protein
MARYIPINNLGNKYFSPCSGVGRVNRDMNPKLPSERRIRGKIPDE